MIINIVDYFTEKWNAKKSDNTAGQMKPFKYKKLKKLESLKKKRYLITVLKLIIK